ncbi:MAG TPA: ABATE domain-containing protein [Ktedonobacterales bacterium]
MTKATRQEQTPLISVVPEAQSPHGSLALALINTETVDRGKKRDALSSTDALAQWWAKMGTQFPDQCVIGRAGEPIAWTRELLDAVGELRLALRIVITRVVDQHAAVAEDLKPINEILALGYSALETTREGSVKAVTYLRDPKKGRVLVAVALSALRLLTESDWQRLHQCKNDRCIVFFYDTTKSGTRRWCSPDCMNRARSIQQYQRSKQDDSRQRDGS